MIRFIGERLLLFLLPFVVYGLYLFLARRRNRHATPWTALFIGGLLLVVISFVYTGFVEDNVHKGAYVPPHVVNGKIVPGHFDGDGQSGWKR